MSKRTKDEMNLTIRGVPFFGFWWSGKENIVSFGMKTGLSRNVHLTILLHDNILNAHITDTAKDPKKVWEMEMSLDELKQIAMKSMTSFIKRYYWYQKYYQSRPDILETLGISPELGQQPRKNHDMVNYIKVFNNEDPFIKKRIRKGVREGFRPGLIFKGDDTYFICPLDKKNIFIVNAEIKKTPLWKIPTTQGFFRFIDYLDEEGILEDFFRLNEEKMNQMKVTLLGVLAEEGIHYKLED